MDISRRKVIGALAGVVPVLQLPRAVGQTAALAIEKGPFEATRESLASYRVPEWYRDAKFGIWAHWGPQSAAEYGDWYARNMYIQDSKQYNYHVKKYGHPSKFGFKDIVPTWKAARWDPAHLMQLYKQAGAKYFCSMGVHHDNFDLWNSKYQPRWNAVASGPKKDVVGLFRKAALEEGLKFAISEHLSNSYNWFSTSHGSDKTGPLAGVPYDGTDPKFADLYHELPKDFDIAKATAMSRNAPDWWKLQWFHRIKDLVDNYQPDLLYTDGAIPFEEYGLSIVAHLYNSNAKRHGGHVEAVYTSKGRQECNEGTCVLDLERGVAGGIPANPWQTDTCIGHWHYDVEAEVQIAQNRHRHVGGYRQPQRQPDAELPVAQQRRARSQGEKHPGGDHQVDGGQQRRHLQHAPVESFRGRSGGEGPTRNHWASRLRIQRAHPQGVHGRGSALHDQRQDAVCVCDGLAGKANRHSAARHQRPGGRVEGGECRNARLRGQVGLEAG